MKRIKRLIKFYFSMYLLGAVCTAILFGLIHQQIISNQATISFDQTNSTNNIVKTVKAEELTETLPLLQSKEFPRPTSYKEYYLERYNMTVLELSNKELDYYYFQNNPPRISDLAKQKHCEVAINGSYFAGTKTDANHVGLLSIWGKQYVPLGVERQLTHIAVYHKQSKTIQFNEASKYTPAASSDKIEFQTGPLVIDNDKLQRSFIENSKNGMGQHKRILIATDSTKKIYLIVVRDKVNLIELGNYLKGLEIFGSELDILNLDGGKSVALWSRETPVVNYNSNDRLPLVLCFR